MLWAGCVSNRRRPDEKRAHLDSVPRFPECPLTHKRRDKGDAFIFSLTAHHQQSRDQEGVSTKPDAEVEMPPVPLTQPLEVSELLFSAVPEAHYAVIDLHI